MLVKNKILKIICIIVNLFEGMMGVIAFAVCYAFFLEPDNSDHSESLGFFVLIVALLVILCPNLLFFVKGTFDMKCLLIYQVLPFFLGALLYCMCQLSFPFN